MFKIESYVTPILLSYVDKYVRDFKPNDAQVSLWGGGVALHNLVLKADVLQQEVALPFTLVSGRIHELLIQVPWTKIMSEPIVVTIDTIECVLSLIPPTPADESIPAELPGRRTQVVEAPPGYMQALVRRIVSNIALRVHHLIVKYVQDDIVLSLNVKHLAVDSAGADWLPAFADIEQHEPVIRRLMRLDDLTLCLDRADSDGKIRFYQEPLLYRCQLDLRVLTRLVSATTRRASSLSVQVRSTKLAWGVTCDQLVLLLRLMRERPVVEPNPPPPTPKFASQSQAQPLHERSINSAEPTRQESWSDWAWSWLPTWMDREGAVEEATMPAVPIPVQFTAYLDDVSLVFKVMEAESVNRKRARSILELSARHAAVKSSLRAPTLMRVQLGLRDLALASHGKCVCGHLDLNAAKEEPTIYLHKIEEEKSDELWSWPEEDMTDIKVELAEVADEDLQQTPTFAAEDEDTPAEETTASSLEPESPTEIDELWIKMAPLLYIEYTHERSPPTAFTNPYENPPIDFEYSDWTEVCNAKVRLKPLELRVSMGLLHRITSLGTAMQDLPPPIEPDLPIRTLTVEECEALLDNLPQRRASIDAEGVRVRLVPWDHSPSERPSEAALHLDLVVPRALVVLTGPLYPHRVCSAACQMPNDAGPLWHGARLHVSGSFASLQAQISAPGDAQPRPCARADLRFVVNTLLNKHLFKGRESVVVNYLVKIREANVCGSAARLQAACQVPFSFGKEHVSLLLKHTTLARDALSDEESVAIDLTLEELSLRGYLTDHVNTHIVSMQSARATAFHAPKGGELKQAWLFSAPDTPTTTPYLRSAIQWCVKTIPTSFDYVGLWTEPVSYSADPLLIAWLAYKPTVRPGLDPMAMVTAQSLLKPLPSTQFFVRRRTTPPSSSGRATRSGVGAELVHQRPRSLGSSSEPSERREQKPVVQTAKPVPSWTSSEWLTQMHARLRHMLVHVELGLVMLYVSSASASALDCASLHDAMERHATQHNPVLGLSLGRISMHSNSSKKHLWQEIRHDGPTFIAEATVNPDDDSFPWKMLLADVSCYTLELRNKTDQSNREQPGGLRSQLKTPAVAQPKTVLELLTTTVTMSVVTKSLQLKSGPKKEHKKHAETSTQEDRIKYFTSGVDFKPSTLKEFFRGPASKRKSTSEPEAIPEAKEIPTSPLQKANGPVVSLGVHLHADTPPIIVRLDREQVHLVASALHGLQHIVTLLQRGPVISKLSYTSLGGPHRSLVRSVSELEELRSQSEETPSDNRSELISIYESRSILDPGYKLKTFFWFQWVVSRATLVVATSTVKLAFDADDIISTVDLQQHYSQFKMKVASASVRHYERTGSDEWTAAVMGGRVVEAREPTNAQEENHFMSVTVTKAQIANLPPNWKEELHPKLLEQKNSVESMWEIYATLAPLEVVVQPTILENVVTLLQQFAPRSFCSLRTEQTQRTSYWQWPFCYVNAGGLRLLLTSEDEEKHSDDTFMVVIGKVTVNPHPENPICRRTISTGAETSWMGGSGPFEGRQYEVIIKNFAVKSAQFSQLVHQETSEKEMQSSGCENPALKWAQPVLSPTITSILHAVDIGCVLAPAMYVGGVLTCGPALELNLLSDCAFELAVSQLGLGQRVLRDVLTALSQHRPPGLSLEQDACPYASLLKDFGNVEELSMLSEPYSLDETLRPSGVEVFAEPAATTTTGHYTDSGVETVTSHSMKSSRRGDDHLPSAKKSVSVAFVDQMVDPSEFLEVFVTMGTIDLSLYAEDDSSAEVVALRPPPVPSAPPEPPSQVNIVLEESESKKDELSATGSRKSLTEINKNPEMTKTATNFKSIYSRRAEGTVPLLHVTLHQPNLYYWRRKAQKSLQVSLFNAWVGLGAGQVGGQWNAALLNTARGSPDPATDIPPALITIKTTTVGSCSTKGSVKIDVERPVQVEVSTDRLRRLQGIMALIKLEMSRCTDKVASPVMELPFLYRLRRSLLHQSIESVTVHTSQLSLFGSEGAVGCDTASVQIAAGARPERVTARVVVSALLATTGPPSDRRHVLLQPMKLGAELEALWETWRRLEGGMSTCEPTVRVSVDLDRLALDLRPCELAAANRIRDASQQFLETREGDSVTSKKFNPTPDNRSRSSTPGLQISHTNSVPQEPTDHYYKDDLRSGAFKIINGVQLPMAYQVTLAGPAVAWRYPHPRAITRIVTFPLPGQDEEVDCVLELYSPMLMRWHAHTYFKIPVGEPRELQLCKTSPDAVFAHVWRYRALVQNEPKDVPFVFDVNRFLPKADPLMFEYQPDMECPRGQVAVTAEQLSGVVRVDSYFAPSALPRVRLSLRLTALDLHVHNSLPTLSRHVHSLEGYYVSRPLMRSHRVLTLLTRDSALHAHLGSSTGYQILFDTKIASDILDCATGTMEPLIEEFRFEAALGVPGGEISSAHFRSWTAAVHVALHVPRLRTIHSLAGDWRQAIDECTRESASANSKEVPPENIYTKRELAAATATALDGRVSLWLHNSCASALRVGQEGTDELVPLGPGARLAYRWRSPTAVKRIHIALAGPSTEWYWSNSIPFAAGLHRLRLEDAESLGGKTSPGGGVYAHVRVEEVGARRFMHFGGRLALANMLRYGLLYKVRARCPEASQWRTVCSGELESESVGRSVMCASDCEMTLKIKFAAHDTGWSGDIPLKECPKENVPWLVKVPSEGEVPYVSVWCRVVRARSDGRVLATLWPLYVLHSHLPLDTDVLIVTENNATFLENVDETNSAPLVQTAPGRGTSTHLVAPGTTSARHNLSFQYRNIDCPVTREAIPLHYGVTDTSVFDKRAPVNTIEEVVQDIFTWLERSGRNSVSSWPYSIVAKHWPGNWQPALMQPKCDITIRYQAVRAGGGCSLELQLCPLVLLCNAAPIALTLRAHDAAPLCKLEAGAAIAPPAAVLKKPFFISVEVGRETFVSGQLEISDEAPGRYADPPPGHVTLDRATPFTVHCNQKVAMLTMYYEIKQEINVLGVSTTFVLINQLETDILVSAVAVPVGTSPVELRPKTFKFVEPTKEGSIHGTPLCRFWLKGRLRSSGDPSELAAFLCIALPAGGYPASMPVPVRLGEPPLRRAVALIDITNKPVAVVVTQLKHEGRWLVMVAPDPCPQFLVHNLTSTPLALAQPLRDSREPSTLHTAAVKECNGAVWYCTIAAGAMIHYSSPAYCARYPPPATTSPPYPPDDLQFITLARARDDELEPSWCPGVAVGEGSQLLQLVGGATVKLRVRCFPHSTLLELRDVDQNDISASDIRNRLLDPDRSKSTSRVESMKKTSSWRLQRTEANEKSPVEYDESTLGPLNTYTTAVMLSRPSESQLSIAPPLLDHETPTTSIKMDFANDDDGKSTRFNKEESPSMSFLYPEEPRAEWHDENTPFARSERARCVISAMSVELSASAEARPLVALHVTRAALLVLTDPQRTKTTISIAGIQIDNQQYETGQFDFGVVATTAAEALPEEPWPPLWSLLVERQLFATRQEGARVLLLVQHDTWRAGDDEYTELTELEISAGPLALYIEDAYVSALVDLARLALPPPLGNDGAPALLELRTLQVPLRLQALLINPLDLTLTLHTAVRMYIALDQSPLHLGVFKLKRAMTSVEQLTHALTVHYLSAAILGAGWVVGGLELLGAPGALAARVGGASGGVRGVASATAAALVRSLSAWAGSLARNLDLLAGDEEHARRAAAARRRPPPSLVAGLMAGVTNFAINILGAVGGLAHHPLVGVAVGETSGATALRRGLLGALTKPLSATADLVAYAGHGLLTQTGWDPVPQPRPSRLRSGESNSGGWRRDCVRWTFRLAELTALAGFEVLLDNAPMQLLLTHKFLVVADPDTEKIVEMIDFRFCSLEPYKGPVIELCVTQRRVSKMMETRGIDEDDEYQLSAAAMARVARYTGASGAEGALTSEARVLSLLPAPGRSGSLHAALAAALRHNSDAHFPLL